MSVLLRERDDDDVYHYIGRRLKLERETERTWVCSGVKQGRWVLRGKDGFAGGKGGFY